MEVEIEIAKEEETSERKHGGRVLYEGERGKKGGTERQNALRRTIETA